MDEAATLSYLTLKQLEWVTGKWLAEKWSDQVLLCRWGVFSLSGWQADLNRHVPTHSPHLQQLGQASEVRHYTGFKSLLLLILLFFVLIVSLKLFQAQLPLFLISPLHFVVPFYLLSLSRKDCFGCNRLARPPQPSLAASVWAACVGVGQ